MSGENLIQTTLRQEQLSIAYIKAIASYCGYGADVPTIDHDSVDITISSSAGKKAKIDIQAKATTTVSDSSKDFSFSLSVKNYKELRDECINPRILVVFCMPPEKENWIKHSQDELALRKCAYWVSLSSEPETTNTDSITITVPASNMLSPDSLNELMGKADRREL